MCNRWWTLTILAGLLTLPPAPARAEDVIFPPEREPAPPAMRLFRQDGRGPDRDGVPEQRSPAEGTVRGRLLQRGRPLVDCHVVLVPMREEKGVNCYDGGRQPLSVTTDDEGVYDFERVPAGAYKLTWLPAGKTQWIRRIAIKPDVMVHSGENVSLRDIRMAMQTIN